MVNGAEHSPDTEQTQGLSTRSASVSRSSLDMTGLGERSGELGTVSRSSLEMTGLGERRGELGTGSGSSLEMTDGGTRR